LLLCCAVILLIGDAYWKFTLSAINCFRILLVQLFEKVTFENFGPKSTFPESTASSLLFQNVRFGPNPHHTHTHTQKKEKKNLFLFLRCQTPSDS
jgi:hypothetical protein